MKTKETSVVKPEDLSLILDLTHDCPFEIGNISFNQDTSTLVIIYGGEEHGRRKVVSNILFLNKVEMPLVERRLHVFYVKNYSISDTEMIGASSFSNITYDAKQQRLSITTNTSVSLEVDILNFRVSVEETDIVIGKVERYEMLGCEFRERVELAERINNQDSRQ